MALLTISIDTDFEEFWRYNLVVMASVKRGDEQVELLKYKDEVAAVGSELVEPPKGYNPNRKVELRCEAAESLTLYIYIIPHTLPYERCVAVTEPFELRVKVKGGNRNLYSNRHLINQWSGENLIIDVKTEAD